MKHDTMIGKRISVGLLAALLVVSAIGAGLPSSVLAVSSSDDNDSRATATAIDVGTAANGTIEQSDVDWHAVEVESGKSIFATLTITTENAENLRFDLFNSDGEKIGEYPNDMLGPAYSTKRLVAGDSAFGGDVAEQSGTYYVRVQAAGETVGEPTDYELTVETDELDGNDPNEQPNTATQIEADETIAGVLSGSDRDTYAVDLEKGETITVSADYEDSDFLPYTYLVGPNASDATLDPYHDREYSVAREQAGGEHKFTYTATTTGTHFLRVNPYGDSSTIGSFNEKASYEISVDVSGEDDDSASDGDNSRTNATEIAIGETTNSALDSENDSDWYAVDLDEGQGFTAEVVHTNREDPSTEVSFDVYDPSDNRIGEAPFDRPINAYRTSPASNIAYGADVVEQDGTHYIRVEGDEGADYSLTVETDELDQYDPNEQPESATHIESGETVAGTLTGYDRDLYALDLEQGQTVNVTGSGGQSLWVANSSVPSPMPEDYYFSDSYAVANDDVMDGTLSFTANQTGMYYLKVVTPVEMSTAGSFFESSPYEMSVDVAGQNNSSPPTDDPDDEERNETPNDTDDSNENKNENELNKPSSGADDPERIEESNGMVSDESNQSDETDEDSSDNTDDTDDSTSDESDETDEDSTDSTDDTEDDTSDESDQSDDADETSDQSDETDEDSSDLSDC
ncbi:hypothetical protein [Halocatena marina]|uniref:hypothetical protein n=1 Tax=Halocatena marina TaxID=2934937 RepID=UPI00200BAF2E|nr:hypothetical protein [Halocatena marina]